MQLNSVRAVITGGVSGLGFAVAQHLVANGGKVALFDVNDDKGAAAVAELGDANARYFRTDVTDEAGVRRQRRRGEGFPRRPERRDQLRRHPRRRPRARQGRRDAAQAVPGTVMVNLVGSFNVAKAAAERMQHNEAGIDGERGVIVNTASVAAYEGQIGQAAYSASKGGVVGMTLPMARELARFGIRVMTIAPGIFWTPMVDGMPEAVQQSLSRRSRSRRAWASRRNSPTWSPTSSATPTSTAKPSAWTARRGWRRSKARRGQSWLQRAGALRARAGCISYWPTGCSCRAAR